MNKLPVRLHTIIGLIIGVALLIAPWLFAFSTLSGAAVSTAILIGILLIANELTSPSTLSPLKLTSLRAHLMIDIVLGILLTASPWLFDFADQPLNAWLPHVVVGLVIVAVALLSNNTDEEHRAL